MKYPKIDDIFKKMMILSADIYIYICVCVCMYVYIYTYICISLIADASPFADVFFWMILCNVAQAGKSAVCT